MTLIILSLFIACLLILELDSQLDFPAIWACRASGRLDGGMVLAYRGTGRLGCYRASERG